MKLSIITINRNNAAGLEKTMRSVLCQTCKDFEYVVVDGASTDDSVDVIKRMIGQVVEPSEAPVVKWLSEPDKGIYNAMNKGIRMATGDYFQILNSADCLCDEFVVERMLAKLSDLNSRAENSSSCNLNPVSIFYGNMIKCFSDGRQVVDKCFAGQEITMLGMYTGTLNHDPAYIRRDLFEKYGFYDENLKICSDWKWYLKAIVVGGEKPEYFDTNVTLFDMGGISETEANKEKIRAERRRTLEELFPKSIICDYDRYARDIYMMRRIRRHGWAFKVVNLIERVLFKMEKRQSKRKQEQVWN